MTFRADKARREPLGEGSSPRQRRGLDREYADRLTGRARADRPSLFLWPGRIPGGEPRTTSGGMEKMKHVTIGVDVSKDHIDAHRLADGAARRFANDQRGHKALIEWLAERGPRTVSYSSRPGLIIAASSARSARPAFHSSRSIRVRRAASPSHRQACEDRSPGCGYAGSHGSGAGA
jgi:hypothetical protein